MKKTYLIFCLLFLSLLSFGQKDTSRKVSKQLLLYGGVQFPELLTLNKALQKHNYPGFNSRDMAVGVGLLRLKKRVVLHFDYFYHGQSKQKDTIMNSMATHGLGVSIGYCYIKQKKLQMYSMIGVNVLSTKLNITDMRSAPGNFDHYVSRLGNQLNMNIETITAHISTNIVYTTRKSKNPKNTGRYLFGLRCGYLLPILMQWSSPNTVGGNSLVSVMDPGPKMNPGGFYSMLVLGLTFR